MDESDELFVVIDEIPSENGEHCISGESDCQSRLLKKNIWNSAHVFTSRDAFYSKIEKYFNTRTYTDVNIICHDRTFRCHRLALAAASEFFHKTFAESPTAEDVDLSDTIHCDTFEQILVYVYRGEVVPIDDENVFNLLVDSSTLRLTDIEDRCVHYLTQKNIPIDQALLIYFHALDSHMSLIPAACKCVLEHLDFFRQQRTFLKMSLQDFGTLLEYFQPSSASRETRLLDVIFEWVCRKTGVCEERWSYFTKLVEKVQFRTVSAEYVAEYFKRNSIDSNARSSRREISRTAPELDSEMLHLYIGTVYGTTTCYNTKDPSERKLNIFSLQDNGSDESVGWHHSGTVIRPSFQKLRIVESNNRLYSLKLSQDQWSFGWSTAIDISIDMRSLALPFGVLSMSPSDFTECHYNRSERKLFSLCHLQKKIYLSGLHENVGFQCYDTELDVWSRIPVLSKHNEPKNIISDDTRLYMIHKPHSSGSFYFTAYDPRDGKVKKLSNGGLRYLKWCDEPYSYHKGKIYLPEYDVGSCPTSIPTLKMAVYDPILDHWEIQNSKFVYDHFTQSRRLVSFNNRLWLFGLQDGVVYNKTYDSYLQRWSNVHVDGLFSVLLNCELYPTDFLDAIVSKSF